MMIKRSALLLLPLLAHHHQLNLSAAALSLGFQDPKLSGFQPDVARDDCDASGGSCHFKTKQMFRTICGESTYVNSTVSTTSPLVEDCRALRDERWSLRDNWIAKGFKDNTRCIT
ncbi:hypothetical protein C8034_v007258 [Colletotrichum sidae]|uniref:Uncharacterized protein n=1 Tax=Colletotrichum sidae TaxID=1347389 RepID=A0A4R8T403_9PEZI|nr:hypothetical protein C8034_v007258 [Colletotrichum sidae]